MVSIAAGSDLRGIWRRGLRFCGDETLGPIDENRIVDPVGRDRDDVLSCPIRFEDGQSNCIEPLQQPPRVSEIRW